MHTLCQINHARVYICSISIQGPQRARITWSSKWHFLLVTCRLQFMESRRAILRNKSWVGFCSAAQPTNHPEPGSRASACTKNGTCRRALLTSTNSQAKRTNQPINNNERFVYNSVHNEFAQMPACITMSHCVQYTQHTHAAHLLNNTRAQPGIMTSTFCARKRTNPVLFASNVLSVLLAVCVRAPSS